MSERETTPEVADDQVAVLEQSAAAYLLRVARGDQLVVEVVDGDVEAAVDALGDDGRVEVLRHGRPRDLVERQQAVQDDLCTPHTRLSSRRCNTIQYYRYLVYSSCKKLSTGVLPSSIYTVPQKKNTTQPPAIISTIVVRFQ